MVEQVTGCPQDDVPRGGRDDARQLRRRPDRRRLLRGRLDPAHLRRADDRRCALLQLLLGNIGRPGGGIMALRGHATIQGITDIPTLYHSIHGYMPAPTVLKKHDTLSDYLTTETLPTGYWANTPKFMVRYLKSMYGDAATAENDFGYDWHPKIIGDHSHMPMFVAMADGRVQGHVRASARTRPTSLERQLQRAGAAQARLAGGQGQLGDRDGRPSGTTRRRSRTARSSRRTSRPRSSSSRSARSPRTRARSPTPSGCSSATTRRPTRRAIAAPTSGSPTSSASG